MKKLLYVGALSLMAFSGFGQNKIEFKEYDLPNGIHVILHEDHSTPIVAVSVLYHVGSKNEKPGRSGFAHFFEHLLFEGSENISRGEYSALVEKNGGSLNANTSNDRTFYFELLPSNQLEMGLWLESERMLHAKVDNTGIETQRSVVKEEKRQRVDNQPYGRFITEVFDRMFKGHSYQWTPIGSMEDLDAAQEEDYVNFYQTYYVPSNATISVAGDISPSQTEKLIAKYFGSIPSGQAINLYRNYLRMSDDRFKQEYGVAKDKFDSKNFMASKTPEAKKLIQTYQSTPTSISRPANYSGKLNKVVIDTVYDNIQLPALFLSYHTPNQTDPDFYALEMMNEVLSGGSSSRLNKSIVEKKQLAVNTFSFPYGMEAGGVQIFGAIANPDSDLEVVLAEFDSQVKTIQDELISQEEFEKIKNKIENDVVSQNSSMGGISESLADNYVYYGSANRVNTLIQNYNKVTREDIQRVAKKYLTQKERLILYYLPKEK